MNTIQAIETRWNGIYFRSRREARWAVFFDTLGIRYEYEKEGYSLPSGPYLPDFYIPHINVWIEIKGTWPTDSEYEKLQELVTATNQCGFLFWGDLVTPDLGNSEASAKVFPEGGVDYSHWWCECPHCRMLTIQFNGRSDRTPCNCPKSGHGDKGYTYDSPRLRRAYDTARGARFGK